MIFFQPATEAACSDIFPTMALPRSILVIFAAAGLGLVVAAGSRAERGQSSDASEVMSWIRSGHELSQLVRRAADTVTHLFTHAREAAEVVSSLLAAADQSVDSVAPLIEEPAPAIRLVQLAGPIDLPQAAPLPPDAKIFRVSARCAAMANAASTWRERVTMRSETIAQDAARLSREAQRVVWFKM